MLQAIGLERLQRAPHRFGTGQLARVRRGEQARLLGDGERLRVGLRRPDGLVVGETERHDAAVGARRGQARLLDRDRRLDRAVGGEHEADADPELLAGRVQCVEDHVDDRLVLAEAVPVVRGVERRLDPHRTVEHAVLDDLVHEPREVLGRLEHLAGRDVRVGERGERAVAPDLGHRDPGGVGELGQGRRPHRALEMKMEVALRKGAQVSGGGVRHDEHRRGRHRRVVALPWSRNAVFTRGTRRGNPSLVVSTDR